MDQASTTWKPSILIAPLDWGLGHATRCIPIINALIQKNCNVLIAGEGKTSALLHKEFPHLTFVDLKGYRVSYSRSKWALPFSIGRQIPKILSTIQYENERLKEIVKEHSVHGIISDNRYGFYHDRVPSVFLTHQLRVKTGLGPLADNYLQKLNYQYINRFTQCWVPDGPTVQNLGGELSHSKCLLAVPCRYIGVLSRFQRAAGKENHLLVLLSGPEPQRTVFEDVLIRQLAEYNSPVILVRGLPGEAETLSLGPNVTVYNHLASGELNRLMNDASVIVSRCGYSTVMDLAVLEKKSILVPTPGQTEQEYLAKHLMSSNFAVCIDQGKFRLKQALELSGSFPYQLDSFAPESYLSGALDDFLSYIRTNRE
jgi:UDP-N-acetylglucosamine transferase subunit ALG13